MSAARSYTRKTLGIIHVRYQFWFRSDCGASTIIKKLGNKESLFSKELEKNTEIKFKIHAKNSSRRNSEIRRTAWKLTEIRDFAAAGEFLKDSAWNRQKSFMFFARISIYLELNPQNFRLRQRNLLFPHNPEFSSIILSFFETTPLPLGGYGISAYTFGPGKTRNYSPMIDLIF